MDIGAKFPETRGLGSVSREGWDRVYIVSKLILMFLTLVALTGIMLNKPYHQRSSTVKTLQGSGTYRQNVCSSPRPTL